MHKRFGSSNTSDEQVHIIKLSKSGGCVDRDDSYMRQLRQAQIRSYFFGGAKSALSPVTMGVDFDAIKVLRFVERTSIMPPPPVTRTKRHGSANDEAATKHDPMASSFLPGTDDDVPSTHVRSWQALYESTPPTVAMHNALLVLKHTPQSSSSSQDGIRDAPVIGYVYVADVEEKTKKLRLLSPVGGRLPPGPVVWGTWDGGLAVGMGGMLGG
jgi:polyribonucleotide 5'-hydroxyl-kinase